VASLIAGTDYDELPGSPRMTVDRVNGLTGRRTFKVAWDKAIDFTAAMIGGWTTIGTVVVRQEPNPFPGYPFLLATVSDIDPLDPESVMGGDVTTLRHGAADYTYAKVVIQYRVPDPGPEEDSGNDIEDPPDGTVLEYSRQVGGQILSTPGRSWKWSDDTKVSTDVNPGVVIPTIVHNLRWSNVPDTLVPWDDIRDKTGSINSIQYLGAAAERLLFSGGIASRMWDLQALAAGEYQQAWRLEYTFEEQCKPQDKGWNHFWRNEDDGAGTPSHWLSIKTDPGDDPPYASASFKSLTAFRA